MKLIKQSFEILDNIDGAEILRKIEACGRTCYKSESAITDDSAKAFVARIIKSGHHSVLEHVNVSARLITNRGVLAELTRHRLASYSVESTRYCNYGNKEMEFIEPVWLLRSGYEKMQFESALEECENTYNDLIASGWRPEQAREVLPNALKTEIIITANLREWRHIFTLRCAKAAHPQIRDLMMNGLLQFNQLIPVVFDDIYEKFHLDDIKY